MLQPLFDKYCSHVGWILPFKHIFDTKLNWVAFIYNDHAWSPETIEWLGPVERNNVMDTNGLTVAWNPTQTVRNMLNPRKPAKPIEIPRPPIPPFRSKLPIPHLPGTPYGGYSPLTFEEWATKKN